MSLSPSLDVERSSLCNCVVNFLLEENYILTAFELLHELLEDGRDDQAIRLREFFSDASKFPPDQIARFGALKGTKYVTANIYFPTVIIIHRKLLDLEDGEDTVLSSMAKPMVEKFSKYWSSYSTILAIAIILDPRYKLKFVEYSYNKIYGDDSVELTNLKKELYDMFDLYMDGIISTTCTSSQARDSQSTFNNDITDTFFEEFDNANHVILSQKSQLQTYLDDDLYDRKMKLDILQFWKGSESRYPQVAQMARDILAIPISTVASESAFSIGGRVVDQYRSTLRPDIIEALICTRDWLYGQKGGVPSVEELTEDITVASEDKDV